ncbi:GNAT family N-acetyltransferase [Hymenobacter busanensis]|uniref:GNAT family N-acetyltransferase n=1 Tax=Hymenobacter busanensis TaxID=2607656 RepID=A0A7L4ZXG5_9BACT|nr:GNAT family protein [Hymenobacter busanensis]KAA9339326.1 GNAT family N-acetyltransferase [Hymenobacter busanensis]QHJ06912.1 GNAT family N-acetyltransferase [Hymenobacter busanensis]
MIKLEPFTPADFSQLIEWINDERLMKEWSGSLFAFPLTNDALEWYIEGANDLKNPDVLVYKAVDTKNGAVVGHISLGGISQRDRAGRITRVLVGDAAARGRGFCTGMITALLRIGFEELHLHRISLGVYDFNHAAIKCYLKSGFKQEGVLRDVVRHGNEYWSLVEMGILEDEWRTLHPKSKATV